MIRLFLSLWVMGCILFGTVAFGQPNAGPLVQRHWFEARSTHFNIYSCGATQEVARLAARLEQFHDAYSQLAGAQAVSSPPIVVMAYPDHAAMEPFLPLYQGKPANLGAFFKRGSDENLISLGLAGAANAHSMEMIFHEYTHLLLRQNGRIWPPWLQEGMAEIYSTFQAGGHGVRVGLPIAHHLRRLKQEQFMPLSELFAVTHESPQYNEREYQGMFYAESWLLTHYLMLGDNAVIKSRFGQLTTLLRRGQTPEQAFTNAFGVSVRVMENGLHHYLEKGQFAPLDLVVKGDLSAPQALTTRSLSPAEVCFHLGDQLLRVGQFDNAESYFRQGSQLSPESPLPYEGLGLLASEREKSDEALRQLREAMKHGSTSFLVHFAYARERYRQTEDGQHRYSHLDKDPAAEVRGEFQKSIALMPDFGPAHELLGFFEMVQGENLAGAEQQMQKAIQLEPENQSYLLSLASLQIMKKDSDAARHTLEILRMPQVDAKVRAHAEEMLAEINNHARQ